MGKKLDIGVNNIARKGKAAWIGVDNKARKIKKMWIGDENGIARLFFGGGLVARRLIAVTWYSTYYSDDKGDTWTKKTQSQGCNISQAATNGETMVIAAHSKDGAEMIRYTKDGETWTKVSTFNCGNMNAPNYLSYLPELNKFFCVKQPSLSSEYASVYESEDGVKWKYAFMNNSADALRCPIFYDAVNDLYLTVGKYTSNMSYAGVLYRAPDATNWSCATHYTSSTFGSGNAEIIATHDGLSVSLYGSTDAVYPIYSYNGKTWTKGAKTEIYSPAGAIVYGNDRFVYVGSNKSEAWYSFDGKVWTKATGEPFVWGNSKQLIYDGNQFLIVDVSGNMYRSADGTAWEKMSQKLDTYGAISFLT